MNIRHDVSRELPPKKPEWQHSNQVLVYYESIPELGVTDKYGIAYYHYDPPFKNQGEWIDFCNSDRSPKYWWDLPSINSTNIEKEDTEDEFDLAKCPNCDENAWDGRICHVCGAKNI